MEGKELALVHGRTDIPLWTQKLSDIVDERASQYGSRVAAVFPWQNHRLTFTQLAQRSKVLARAMLGIGLRHGDCVGILAGNCYEYIEVFLGGARIGCPVVVLNTTYTPTELQGAVTRSGELVQSFCDYLLIADVDCKLLFIPSRIGARSLAEHIRQVTGSESAPPELRRTIHLGRSAKTNESAGLLSYEDFVSSSSTSVSDGTLKQAEAAVRSTDVLNLQFTSGTTGAPKAAMLTHM